MNIRICIAELLSLHDCVIIPGFGGFIGNYSPARIDSVHHTFQPPAKKLLFNINLKQNDGLLANAVAGAFRTSYTEACKIIDEFSEECRYTLKTEKTVILPQIGKLFQGKEGIIHFEQDQSANLLPDAFGLVPFISPPVIRSSSAVSHTWNHSNKTISNTGKKFVFPRALKWAAVIVLPIGVAAVIGVTQFDKISANLANNAGILSSVFTRFSSTSSLAVKKEAPVLKPNIVVDSIPGAGNQTTLTSSDEQSQEKLPVTTLSADDLMTIRADDRYAVIVGAFRVQENAENLVAELRRKGIEASVFDQSRTGLFRVTIGTSSTRDGAKQLLAMARSADFSGAWILAK